MMNDLEIQTNLLPKMTSRCPLCRHASRRLFRKYDYWIRGCKSCYHRFAELSPTLYHTTQVYGDDYFEGGGAGYTDYLTESRLLRQHGQRYARLLRRYMKPGTVLDVGSAAGFVLQGLTDGGWRGSGIEPNKRMASYARTVLDLDVQTGAFENLYPQSRYDLITMIQVVAHFYDLRQAFEVADAHTKPGGFWLIESWNRNSWTARVLRSHWHEYSPPSVLHWFSPQGLQQLGEQFGYRAVAYGRPKKMIAGSHAKSLLRYKLGKSSVGLAIAKALDIIPDQLMIPYPAEDLFWILLQKQVES